MGRLEKKEMLRQLQLMKDQGIDEFFIYPSMGLEYPHFLQESWFDYVKFAIREAKKRHMRVWIYDDLNWPSGTAGGYFLRKFPEYRMRAVTRTETTLQPGEDFALALNFEPLSVFVRPENQQNWEKVTLDSENFYRNERDCAVALQCFEVQIFNYHTLGARGTTTTWNQQGLCDLLNPDAVRAWMSCIHDLYYQHCADECGKTLRGFFFDEPHCMPNYGQLPWTPGLETKFLEQYGYDIREHLHEFFEDLPGSEKTRFDFWSLYSDLTSESFGKTVATWCTEHNLLSTGHCVYEEITNQNLRLYWNGEIHGILKHQHIPGMDLLTDNTPYHLGTAYHWYGKNADMARTFLFTAKQACSTARYSGAKRVLAEAMGVCNLNAPLQREKLVFDWLAASGVSMLNENCMTYTIKGYSKRTISNKAWSQPWFRLYHLFADYVREMSVFASQTLLCNVAVLTPEVTIRACTWITPDRSIAAKGDVSETMIAILDHLMRNHIDSELLFEDVFLAGSIQDGNILVPNSSFRIVILPKCVVLTEALANKLLEFATSGGTILCIGERPNRTPEGGLLDFTRFPLINVDQLAKAINKAAAQLYSITDNGELFTALRGCKDAPTLFIANMGTSATTAKLETNCLPSPICAKIVGENTEWAFEGNSIHLEPEQSIFLHFGKSAGQSRAPISYGPMLAQGSELTGEWDYSLTLPNNALCNFELGLTPNDEIEHPEKIRLWLPVTYDGCHDLDFTPEESPAYWLRTNFFIDELSVIPNLSLIVEEDECLKVFVNGTEIRESFPYNLWTHENRKYDLSGAVHVGKNQMMILCKTSQWNSLDKRTIFPLNFIEPCVLHGNFAVKSGQPEIHLKPLPKNLSSGDVGPQGFPWYVGEIFYQRFITAQKPPALTLASPNAGGVEVRCNDQLIDKKLWGPYRFDLSSAWRQGKNLLSICLAGTLGNLLPRAYGCRKVRAMPLGLNSVIMHE
ncbi:MAG: hypothetical protein GX946_04050 [Oligosphaeraceae bacterium]|nr:hypothetical protein [Oligosphaeraceae bacterium]